MFITITGQALAIIYLHAFSFIYTDINSLVYLDTFAVGGGVPVEDQPDVSAVLSAYKQQGDPALYEEYYSGLKHFIECALDCHRAELSQLFYPLFVHMYLELVYNQHENEAKSFFEK